MTHKEQDSCQLKKQAIIIATRNHLDTERDLSIDPFEYYLKLKAKVESKQLSDPLSLTSCFMGEDFDLDDLVTIETDADIIYSAITDALNTAQKGIIRQGTEYLESGQAMGLQEVANLNMIDMYKKGL